MPVAVIDGIETRYETAGTGPAILMYSPGGFDSSLENWTTFGNWPRLNLLEHLSAEFTYVIFDRRESGQSGGRFERIGWQHYVRQGVGLLDHLGIDRAHFMGGCVGCTSVAAVAVAHPERVLSMVLFSPAGGPHYRMAQHRRFARHLGFVAESGTAGVVDLARSHSESFVKDPRVGPWATVIRRDEAFALEYADLSTERYLTVVSGLVRLMFDRDTVPGLEPEDLLELDTPTLIVPGQDRSHAPSAARFLQECLPHADYWDIPVPEQTEEVVAPRLLEFLATSSPPATS